MFNYLKKTLKHYIIIIVILYLRSRKPKFPSTVTLHQRKHSIFKYIKKDNIFKLNDKWVIFGNISKENNVVKSY